MFCVVVSLPHPKSCHFSGFACPRWKGEFASFVTSYDAILVEFFRVVCVLLLDVAGRPCWFSFSVCSFFFVE